MSGIDNPMLFEQLRDSIVALLIANQTGRFRTIDNQKQSTSSKEIEGILRTVQLFFSTGDYPESGRANFRHDVTYQLLLSVSSPSKGDKSIIEDDTASASARQAALLAVQEAEDLVDKSMDELWRMVTQILKDPANIDFGLSTYTVSSPRLTNFRKNQVLDKGTLTTLTASATWTAELTETTPGIVGVEGVQPVIDTDLDERPVNNDTGFDSPEVGMETEQ